MTSPSLSDQKARVDAVDELRALAAELRALAERLELKARTHELQPTLNALEQRLSGPRAVVMLVSEHEDLKRRFLERLLGPNLIQVPKPTAACVRLEYGATPASMQNGQLAQTTDAIRLPNPALKTGLAVVDTPVLKSGQPDASMREYAEQVDACIFVLNRDHELGEASHDFLRRLPEAGARLEIVVENAEALSREERLAARKRLVETLRERCSIEAPRLTLVASVVTEDDGASFWHGRFATFHSVMMRRGREHWLKVTRRMVADALSQVSSEIEFELKSATPGQRHARLRQGMKDLEGLRTRFVEMERPETKRSAKTGTLSDRPAEGLSHRNGHEYQDVGAGTGELSGASATTAALVSSTMPGDNVSAITESTAIQDAGMSGSTASVSLQAKRGLSALFEKKLTRWRERGVDIPLQRTAGIALAIALICLVVWALSPRGFFFRQELGAEWDYQPPKPAPTNPAATSARSDAHADLPKPGNTPLPETSRPAVSNIPVAPPAKRSAAVRMPLTRPIPSGATAGVAPRAKRHHRHLLGLGKLWHWVRHDHSKDSSRAASSAD
jgi:hypothetical protein